MKENLLCQDNVQHTLDAYAAGKPLFPRQLLEDLDRQITQGVDKVCIEDYDGRKREYSLVDPAWTTYCIRYNCIQSLTNLSPFGRLFEWRCAVSISYTKYRPRPKGSLEELTEAHGKQRETWKQSQTCRFLEIQLSKLENFRSIEKIVCFGLGSLGRLDDHSSIRSHTQHAAVQTMVDVLGKGREIRCYAQDPVYDDLDKALLARIGIIPVQDPKGFLEIDSKTLVFSVSPNIPVKQIVADGERPAVMIWNTVELEESTEWRKDTFNGEEIWISPYGTDPDSPRVRAMVEGYKKTKLQDTDDYFGDLTIYVKKE